MGHIDNNSRIELRRIIDLVAEHNLEVNTFMEIGSKDGADAAYISNILSIDPKNIYILKDRFFQQFLFELNLLHFL